MGGIALSYSQEKTPNQRSGLFKRIFSNKHTDKTRHPLPRSYGETVHDVYIDRESDTIAAKIHPAEDTGASANRSNDGVERFPHIKGYNSKRNAPQNEIEKLIDEIFAGYENRIDRMDPPDLTKEALSRLTKIPPGFETVWRDLVRCQIWEKQRKVNHSIEDIYQRTLTYSNQVKVFSDIPLIRETGLQEADGEFDPVLFMDASVIRRNEPNGSTLTAQQGVSRFREDQEFFETGVRKKFFNGAEATVSNRWAHLNNNSGFLFPENQGSSELVVSVVQPLLEGAGYHFNHSSLKIAKFDARMASSEFVRQLQSHLLEVNQAYWSLYFARASYLLHKNLVSETSSVLTQLEDRSDLDALESEVLRARGSLATRKNLLTRSEVAIRNSEERLRALVNDPDQDIGSNAEMVPTTLPVLAKVIEDLQTVAKEALHNRPEIQQGFDQLRAAAVRRDMQKNEKWPTLNLIAELMLSDLQGDFDSSRAFSSQFGDPGYQIGVQFEQPFDNDEARARLLRRELELRQQAKQLKTTIDSVLLEALVSYRELVSAYRDMMGNFETLKASREELRQLRDRIEIDTEEEAGHTTASRLQLILDSMDRNQSAEENFLNTLVAYNTSFAALERAKGTILRTQNVNIERVRDTDDTHKNQDLEQLSITIDSPIGNGGAKSGAKGCQTTVCSIRRGTTYGNPCPDCRHKVENFRSLTAPKPRPKPIPNDPVNLPLDSYETIPLESLPTTNDLIPLNPVLPQVPSVKVKPLELPKPSPNPLFGNGKNNKLFHFGKRPPSAEAKPKKNSTHKKAPIVAKPVGD